MILSAYEFKTFIVLIILCFYLWWQSKKSPEEFAEELVKESHQYNGFNLILADISSSTKSMVYVSNRPKGEPILVQVVSPGVHVISNAKLDSPWHKVCIFWEQLLF